MMEYRKRKEREKKKEKKIKESDRNRNAWCCLTFAADEAGRRVVGN